MIYVLVRQTIDWKDESVFWAQLSELFRPKVEVWNDTFNMPYHIFRHEIKQIAQLNLSRVRGTRCVPLSEIPESAIVVPCDDDDWLAPQLGEVLQQEYDRDVTGYHWTRSFLEVPISRSHQIELLWRRLFPCTPLKWICTTNNYALPKAGNMELLQRGHMAASRAFKQKRATVKKISKQLSIMNRTLASQTSLGWTRPSVKRSELICKYHKYVKLYSSVKRTVAPGLAWAMPYVDKMSELMEMLQVKPSVQRTSQRRIVEQNGGEGG